MMLVRSRHLHVYAWRQGPGRFKVKRGSYPAHGVAFRVRDPRGRDVWRHVRVRLGWRGRSEEGDGIVQFEVDSWRTLGGTGHTRRVGRKTFVRLKAAR